MTPTFHRYWTALTTLNRPIKLGNLARMCFEAGWRSRGGDKVEDILEDQDETKGII